MKCSYFVTLLSLIICLPLMAYNDHRNIRIDSLEHVLKGNNPPKGADLLNIYDELTRGYLPYNAKKAEEYGHKALALSYELNDMSKRQYVLRNIGLLYYGREDYTTALDIFNHALAICDSMEKSKQYQPSEIDDARSALYGSIGNTYNLQGKAHLAIHYYQLALPIFERNGWLESQAILHHNIAELYFSMGNNKKAENHFLLAIEKGRESGDSLMVATPQKGLVKVYLDENKYDNTRQTLQAAYSYFNTHKKEEPTSYAEVIASMSRLNLMAGHQDLVAAQKYADEALSLLSDEMMFENKGDIYAANCEVAMARKEWNKALEYGLRTIHADSLATETDAGCYHLLAEIYIELGQKEKAREMLNKMNDLTIHSATEHYQSGLSQMEVLYETEKKEIQLSALAKEHKLYRWLLIGIGTLVIFLVLFLIYRHLAHQRQKALLAAKVAIETETKERHILARDLHDSIGGMLTLLRLKMEAKDNSALELLDNTVTELRRVSHHLMPEELLRGGLSSALRDFAISIPGAHFQSSGNIQISKEQELVLYRCAYELVNNSIKHAKASHIDLQLTQDSQEITLTVSDNGQGIKDREKDGMGLQNIEERIKPYHGKMHIITHPEKGTEIHIILPT